MNQLSPMGVTGVVVFILGVGFYLVACWLEYAGSKAWPYPRPERWAMPGILVGYVLVATVACAALYSIGVAFKEILL